MQILNQISFKGLWETKRIGSEYEGFKPIYEYHPFKDEKKEDIARRIEDATKDAESCNINTKNIQKGWTLPFTELAYKKFLNGNVLQRTESNIVYYVSKNNLTNNPEFKLDKLEEEYKALKLPRILSAILLPFKKEITGIAHNNRVEIKELQQSDKQDGIKAGYNININAESSAGYSQLYDTKSRLNSEVMPIRRELVFSVPRFKKINDSIELLILTCQDVRKAFMSALRHSVKESNSRAARARILK